MAHLNVSEYPTKLSLDFSSGDTVDLEMKEIGRRPITSRYLFNSQFSLHFFCAYDFLASAYSSDCRSTAPIAPLDQSI